MIEGHGDDIYSYNNSIVSNFSSNIYNKADLSFLKEHLAANISKIHSYPEPDAFSLKQIIAEGNGINTENICITNGATEAIYLLAQAFRGSKTAIVSPTFSEYADACQINEHTITFISSLDEVANDIKLIWLCNPNNPTGTVIDKQVLIEYIERHPNQYIIIDQSYENFTLDEVFAIREGIKYKNLILLHSMTKKYAIPGLRLGYITAHSNLINLISKYCMPWSVNSLAIEAGKFLLKKDFSAINLADYLAETKRLQDSLNGIEGIKVFPSKTHFFLCKVENKKASHLKRFLVNKYGILIRDASNFWGLSESHFRIAAQSPDENNNLIEAIKEFQKIEISKIE